MLPSGSVGGRGAARATRRRTEEIIANVFAGDAIFTRGCQIPFLQHISFLPFLHSDYFFCLSALLSHPARLIQLIFNRGKYESTEINLSCSGIKSAVLLWWCNGGLHTRARSSRPCLALRRAFVFLHSQGGCCLVFAVSGLWHPTCVCVCVCLCRHPTCVCACLYVGTTCYSQGWSSLRPVSLCVYSSGGLLPPDYKKDWWINNIQLSLALSHSLSKALKFVCVSVCVRRHLPMRVCVCVHTHACTCVCVFCCCACCVCVQAFLFVTACVTVCMCVCLQHVSVDQALLHLADSWPLLAGNRQRAFPHWWSRGQTHRWREKTSSLS